MSSSRARSSCGSTSRESESDPPVDPVELYRLIDTAQGYQNEKDVGEAIARSEVPREEIFITTKLVNGQHGHDRALTAFDASLERLGIDVLDLFLIHWPLPMFDQYVESWKALEQLLVDGRVGAIGVSNFEIEHLERLVNETEITPTQNQVELHPESPQEMISQLNVGRRLGPHPNEFDLV